MKSIIKKQLKECGLEGCYKALIMGLNHSERVIVNDFSDSNPYPSCSAINIPRNCNNLKNIFYEFEYSISNRHDHSILRCMGSVFWENKKYFPESIKKYVFVNPTDHVFDEGLSGKLR